MSRRMLRLLAAMLGCLPLLLFNAAQAGIGCRAATPLEAAVYTTPLLNPGVISPRDGTCFVKDLALLMSDGVQISANVFLPKDAAAGGRFPAVVYPTAWATADFFMYVGEQQRMAQAGYVAMAYTSRGFWGSGGQVGVAGPRDIADFSAVIDWLLANTPADAQRIGSAGISYGAILSMLGAAADPRVRAVASLSGYGRLADQMYGNEVPNPTWIAILNLSGQLTARLDPIIAQHSATVLNPDSTQAQIAEVIGWAGQRSPANVVDALNARRVPVLVSKNWQDDMFSPNSSLAMFARLSGPKKLLLQPGIHASSEAAGAVLGVANPIFAQVHRWMDRWLKGVANGVDGEPQVHLQHKFGGQQETLSSWPAPELRSLQYQLGPRGAIRWELACLCWKGHEGSLASSANTQTATDSIDNLADTTATTGPIPLLSVIAETANLPVVNHMATIQRGQGLRYQGPLLGSTLRLRGAPRLQLRVRPSQSRGLLVAYLYDVDLAGFGVLVTHGAKALHWATPGQTRDFSFELNAIAHDVLPGRRLVLVLDTADSLYGSPVRAGERFEMALPFAPGAPMTMTLPIR